MTTHTRGPTTQTQHGTWRTAARGTLWVREDQPEGTHVRRVHRWTHYDGDDASGREIETFTVMLDDTSEVAVTRCDGGPLSMDGLWAGEVYDAAVAAWEASDA